MVAATTARSNLTKHPVAAASVVAVVALMVGMIATSLPIQYVVLGSCVLAATVIASPPTSMCLAVVFVCASGLLRRLLSDETGRTANDPLVIAPLVLVLLAIALYPHRSVLTTPLSAKLSYGIALLTCCTFAVHLNLATSVIYSTALNVTVWILLGMIASERMPDIWPLLYKYLPVLGATIGLYGIYQFLYLPSWDKAWMISSRLTSIGHPLPEQVRVFGTAESPGPYAIVVGVCLVVTIIHCVYDSGLSRISYFVIAGTLLVPLGLTAVRTALLGVVIACVVASLKYLTGIKRAVPIAVSALAYVLLITLVGRFGASSTVLTSDRLANFNAAQDGSVQTRLALFRTARPSFSQPFGQGIAVDPATGLPISLDNAFIDVMFKYGFVTAVLLVVLTLLVVKSAWSMRKADPIQVSAGACSFFLAFFTIASNIFSAGSGIIAAIVFGTVLRYAAHNRREDTTQPRVKKYIHSRRPKSRQATGQGALLWKEPVPTTRPTRRRPLSRKSKQVVTHAGMSIGRHTKR